MDYRIIGIGLLLAVVVASGCIDGGEEPAPDEDVDPGEEPAPGEEDIEEEPAPGEEDIEEEPLPEDDGL